MTAHDHTTFVSGCFRCELGRDEAFDGLVNECKELEAEVEQLREAYSQERRMRDLFETECERLREVLAFKDHRWDEMRHKRDRLCEALERIARLPIDGEEARRIAAAALQEEKP